MPELPDVEGYRRVLAAHAIGCPIERVDVRDAGVLREVTPRRLTEALRGRRFARPWRHGKWLVAPVDDGGAVLLHFGMTGSLTWAEPGEDRHRHDRVVFGFPDGELRYRDARKLRGLWLERDREDVARALADLGPDATEVSRDELGALLAHRRATVKAALTDQSIVAGIGNLLADEILWRARIHPRTPGAHLGTAAIGRLHAAMTTVLRQSIKDGRVPPRPSWLTGRRADPSGSCPRCDTTLAHGRINGRSTTWCPHCQPTEPT